MRQKMLRIQRASTPNYFENYLLLLILLFDGCENIESMIKCPLEVYFINLGHIIVLLNRNIGTYYYIKTF